MKLHRIILAAALASCTTAKPPLPALAPPPAEPGSLELCESVPSGAFDDDPAVPNTDEVWRAMLSGAKRNVAIAQFYVSEKPKDQAGPDKLEPVLAAAEAAVARGVAVRLLVDAQFGKKYPDSLARLSGHGVSVRLLDAQKTMGGVQHAKYLVADERDVYLGSANMDWRSLDHIHELGLHIASRKLASVLLTIYDGDWATAGGEPAPAHGDLTAATLPETIGAQLIEPVASPKGFIPLESLWDLDHIVAAIDAAKRELRIQVLNFETAGHDGAAFDRLDLALRRAAVRGVRVRLMVSHWQKAPKKIGAVQELARVPGIDVRILTIPEAAGGFIPFARVAHAKYMVADDDRVWLGTSNWGGDYFLHSRNVGVMVSGKPLAAQLAGIFDRLAGSPMSEPVDPDKAYEAPKIAP